MAIPTFSNKTIWKNELRIANERYLRTHPELANITSHVVQQALIQKPKDLHRFTAGKSFRMLYAIIAANELIIMYELIECSSIVAYYILPLPFFFFY